MKFFKGLPAILLLAVCVAAQDNGYNYPKPEPPRGTYLPPPTQPPPTRPPQTPPPNQQQSLIDAEGLNPDGEHEPGMPFDFTYAVKDDVGNDFSHQANSDGDVVKGEYRTLLPDGRTQVVKYTADWKNGYNAEVTYEGEAQPYVPPPRTPAPFRPQSETDIDSQGLLPSRQPATRPPPPPPTYRPVVTQPPPPPPTYRPVQTQPPRTQPPRTQPPPTYRPVQTQPPRTQPPPVEPPGLYGAPSVPFGVRNNPKFGYNSK